MPIDSPHPPVNFPEVDIWSFLFGKKDRPFPDDKGEFLPLLILPFCFFLSSTTVW